MYILIEQFTTEKTVSQKFPSLMDALQEARRRFLAHREIFDNVTVGRCVPCHNNTRYFDTESVFEIRTFGTKHPHQHIEIHARNGISWHYYPEQEMNSAIWYAFEYEGRHPSPVAAT